MVHSSKPHTFTPPLVPGVLLRRYKRFFADIRLQDEQEIVAHCPNTGKMTGLLTPGSSVWVQYRGTQGRKLAWSWELASQDGILVGVNTALPNTLVHRAVDEGFIPQLAGYEESRREVTFGDSLFDLWLHGHRSREESCYVEVKNVTMREGKRALFPDAVTDRGRKHLLGLVKAVKTGHRAVQFFLVQRTDCEVFRPAWNIDRSYAETLVEARRQGVEILAWEAQTTSQSICLTRELPIDWEEDD